MQTLYSMNFTSFPPSHPSTWALPALLPKLYQPPSSTSLVTHPSLSPTLTLFSAMPSPNKSIYQLSWAASNFSPRLTSSVKLLINCQLITANLLPSVADGYLFASCIQLAGTCEHKVGTYKFSYYSFPYVTPSLSITLISCLKWRLYVPRGKYLS